MSDFTAPADEWSGRSEGGASRGAGATHGAAEDSRSPANLTEAVTHRLRVHPSRRMKAITGEVESLLDRLAVPERRRAALLASELIAQVVAADPNWNSQPVVLSLQLRGDAVRLEAAGPIAPTVHATADRYVAPDDPAADWGTFLIDRLADRWGLAGEDDRRTVWAEIATPA
jgi:hypothetical protein